MAKSSRASSHGTLDVLDTYHSQASRSSMLTTFDDLTAPPAPSAAGDAKGLEFPGGLSSLYSRIKASVGVKDSAGTPGSSPVLHSVPSSRLQSPLATHFSDIQLPPSRDSAASASTASIKPSLNASRTSLVTTQSRPSIAPSTDSLKSRSDDTSTALKSPAAPLAKGNHRPSIDSSLSAEPRGRDVRSQTADEPFMKRPSQAELDDESDTTEDDMVVVEGGGFANENARLAFPMDAMHNDLAKVRSRPDARYNVAPNTNAARDKADNGSGDTEGPRVTTTAQTPVVAPAPQRPPLVHVGPSHLPGFHASRASSSDGLSSIVTSTTTTVRSPGVAPIDELKQYNATASAGNLSSSTLSHMRRKIVDRAFWMRDENAKDCFNCGDSFSTFRRKHHCRTCGQIFDSKCTSLVTGKVFGQNGSLRVCKPCEAIIYGNDDDSSVYTDEGDQASIYEQQEEIQGMQAQDFDPSESDHTKIGTPTISIPMSRKAGSEKKRRSAVIEVAAPTLARPSSSRSLRSLSGRPRSSSHKRLHSRHQHMRNLRYEDRAPFHQQEVEAFRSRSALPAFHHDNIIDPDLAPFMSDDDSSEDEPASIFATLRDDTPSSLHMDPERGGIGGLLSAMRKGKSRAGDRSGYARDTDNISISSRNPNRHSHSRKRNLSVGSAAHVRPSPRRSKSNSLLRALGPNLVPNLLPHSTPSPQPAVSLPPSGSRITRSASMQGGNAPAVELNQASLQHVRKLLKQMLHESGISHASSWEKALMPILLQCTDDVNPDVQRHDDMDIRHYIKLKKIPGGRPRDTSYVSGVVFTKQIAKKDMLRSIPNPRLIIVTFAIEYARHQTHFMSLDPVIAQEREYLRNLVKRIAALRPSVLLVQRNVSGLALEFLQEAGIVVAYNVKPTVLNAVSRCTQTPMITSVDKLAVDPNHLGLCESFDVKTYVHEGIKKTYIFLSGSQPELGCTIVLRGADPSTLTKLKRITEFMCYVVYNLKLETCLMRDEFVLIPSTSIVGTLRSNPQGTGNTTSMLAAASQGHTEATTSPEHTRDLDANGEKQAAGEDIDAVDDLPAPSFYSDMVEKHRTTILSASPFVQFAQPYLLNQAREHETKLSRLKMLRDQYSAEESEKAEETPEKFELVQPEMVNIMLERTSKQVREFLHAVHAAQYDKALHNYQTQKRQWEAFLFGNTDLFNPHNHQKIATLYSMVNSSTSTPCVGPEIIAMGFYHEHEFDDGFTPDCTLGQYVEDLIQTAHIVCDVDSCNRRMFDHHRQYVHGPGQISVHVFKYPAKLKNMHNTILMWSVCRLCGQETQVMPMSANTWKYSFAKYLELTFWSTPLHPRAHVCPHDIHKDHVRYFGLNNIALRMQYDPVPLYEVIVPRPVITWKVDGDLKLKNEQFLRIEERLDRFMASVRDRLNLIRVDSVIPEKVEICRVEVDKLTKRANEEHAWLRQKLQDKYMSSKYYEIIPFNRAIRAIQEKAVAWDDVFANFEQEFFPSEKDIRRLAALQLKRIFLERDESSSSLASVDEGTESVEEEPAMNERGELPELTGMTSSMSEERARDMLHSVVEEEHTNSPRNDDQTQSEDSPVTPTASRSPESSQLLPIHTPIEALEREDVRHLDLAVPSNYPDGTTSIGDNALATPADAANFEPDLGSPTPTAHPKINPIDKAVADAVDNMPTSPTPAHTSPMTLESKIPRLVETIRRDTAMRPAVVRTQSQPHGIPKVQTQPSSPALTSVNSTGASNVDYPKSFLNESARALEKRMSERLNLGAFRQSLSSSKIPIPRSVPSKRQNEVTKVSALAKHFEQLQREFEKERRRERAMQQRQNRQARAYPVAISRPTVEVYDDVHEAVQERSPSDEDAHASPARISTDNSTLNDSTYTDATTTATTTTNTSPVEERHHKDLITRSRENSIEGTAHSLSQPASDVEGEGSDVEGMPEDIPLPDSIANSQLLDSQLEASLELPKHEKTTLMRMLTSFWSERSASGWAPLSYPLSQNEHVWEDSDIIVREDEPSSIIALALSSPDYLAKLQTFRDDPTIAANGVGGLGASEASIERNLLHEANTNIRYSFTNRGVRAQCKIFYAQSFDALRRKCGVADRFVESLSRCSKWDSKGGKSKSIFLKTLDERFVVKSLSAIEVNAFFRFAPNYFAFTHQNLFKGLPSVIAKMFGLFQVQIKTPGGKDFDWFMLVMENLFYEREPNRRYDLKGSMRNRKVQSTGERDEVLLDENLVDIIYSETPIFVREHTKKLLKASVWNDTLFLQQQNVMDYSLMAGFNDEGREIIVGIIDCIRTYTWDKKLESWIKDRGKNKPTITSPKDYRNRFRAAMEKYILQAPNCWHQFSGRVVGVGVPNAGPAGPRKTIVLENAMGMAAGSSARSAGRRTVSARMAGEEKQVLEVEAGDEEKAAGSKI